MTITKQYLIEICNEFLNGKMEKSDLQKFAWNAISSDETLLDREDVISETIFEWDNEDINFEINRANILLWKNRLLTGQDDLIKSNFWNSHIDHQKEVCTEYKSKWSPINKRLRVGISENIEKDPIHGLRTISNKGTTGWFIWTGEYSESDDFFKPICAEHLLSIRPDIIKYLALEIGFRFLVDSNGYLDIWYDENLKKT